MLILVSDENCPNNIHSIATRRADASDESIVEFLLFFRWQLFTSDCHLLLDDDRFEHP